MDLTQAMLAATESPPPTSIDVDRLITGERRRTRSLYAVTGAAVAAALAVGVVALPQYLSQKPSGQSPGLAPPSTVATATRSPAVCITPAPTVTVPPGGGKTPGSGKTPGGPHPLVPVTESCGAAIARLSDEITAVLQRLAPGVTVTNARDGSPLPARVEKEGALLLGYTAGFNLPGGVMSVRIEAAEQTSAQFRAFAEQQCTMPEAKCRPATVDGAELLIRNDVAGGYGIDVWAVRPDGTMLLTLTRAKIAGQPTPLTEQQLIELVMTPALTVYP
ncbi:hypothetical protein AB0K00_02875 [Dactylosporangium sp. NPDC049525]|uniref:hypothetical protein n=1 Tax=Dactylosporangium sp. NPDC049525 TaxID=3154730 RepID=UPI003431881B